MMTLTATTSLTEADQLTIRMLMTVNAKSKIRISIFESRRMFENKCQETEHVLRIA